uniref:Protein unc-45 homolog B n=1 Tax=Saccoglossus kowalevskii TaxID=10224 RepID=A0ABM0M1E0_SACKO
TFLALTENEKDRGLIIQQGGAKACILLANNGNEEGKTQAAQALAKIAITNNPEIAFPGQRCLEVVRPLIQLLHVEKTGLQNFESLMALTNLAQVSDSVRNRIVKEKGIPAIENYLFEDHDMIRRAAAECMCNLIVNEEVFESHLRENDKVKLLTVLCGMEDPDLVQACAGTLAILSHNEIACKKITAVSTYFDSFLHHIRGVIFNLYCICSIESTSQIRAHINLKMHLLYAGYCFAIYTCNTNGTNTACDICDIICSQCFDHHLCVP